MELKNTEILYSSEQCEILLGEGENGRLYTRKNSGINPEAAEKLRNLHSPYIAKLADYGEDHTVLEYAPGVPLSKAKLNKDRLYGIFRELCEGLSALHGAGVIHRDIKPSNVILRDDGHIIIIDFDAARVKKPTADKDTSFIGTDGFAPPEQYGFMQTDERSDIYALGVTMKLLCDKLGCSSYRGVVEKCMRFNPEQRYSSAKQVKRALFLCRYRAVFAAAAVIALAAGAAVSGFLINRNDPVPAESPAAVTSEIVSSEILSTAEPPQTTPPQTTSPVTPAAFEIPPDSVRELPWEALMLPEGMPRLAESVTEVSTQGNNVFLKWDKMSKPEADSILAGIKRWLNTDEPVYEFDEPEYQAHFKNERYEADFNHSGEESAPYQCLITIKPLDKEETLVFNSALNTEQPVPEGSSRSLDWDSLPLPEGVPKLGEGVSDFDADNNYRWYIEWDKASANEMARMAMLLQSWLGCGSTIISSGGAVSWLIDSPDGNTALEWGFDGGLTVTIGKDIFDEGYSGDI